MHSEDNLRNHYKLHINTLNLQSDEVKRSNAMELEGLKRGLQFLEGYDLTIGELITDRHIQVKKYMKDEHTDKQHYFDCLAFR